MKHLKKQAFIAASIFFSQTFCMLAPNKNNHFRLKDMPKDHIPVIAMQMDLPSIRNFKLVCTTYNNICDIDTILKSSSVTIKKLVNNFDACDKALAHYAQQKNKTMFQWIWDYQNDTDKKKRTKISNDATNTNITLKDLLRIYRGRYENVTTKSQRLQQNKNQKLLNAIKKDNIQAAKISLYNKADFNYIENNKSMLFRACKKGKLKITALLISYGALINSLNTSVSQTPLLIASKNGHKKVVELLLKHNANPNTKDFPFKQTALHYASINGFVEIMSLLIKNGAKINRLNSHFETPLYMACSYGKLESVKLLLENGANARKGDYPRLMLTEKNYSEIRVLLNNYGITPCLEEKIRTVLLKTKTTVTKNIFRLTTLGLFLWVYKITIFRYFYGEKYSYIVDLK